ncbi:hypothetical protein ACFQQB_61155 [Nonomuraea rubra]|uniref:hypothetical protein n=1 Tax=Nonomuraea rubra TaxID=46180 RepID=UPI003607FA99
MGAEPVGGDGAQGSVVGFVEVDDAGEGFALAAAGVQGLVECGGAQDGAGALSQRVWSRSMARMSAWRVMAQKGV